MELHTLVDHLLHKGDFFFIVREDFFFFFWFSKRQNGKANGPGVKYESWGTFHTYTVSKNGIYFLLLLSHLNSEVVYNDTRNHGQFKATRPER